MSAAQTIARSRPDRKKRAKLRRVRHVRALAGAAIVAIAGASNYGWYYWITGRFEVSTDDAYVKADSTIPATRSAHRRGRAARSAP